MPTIYLSNAALDQLDHAQTELDHHIATGRDGRCLACGGPEPCPARIRAAETLARYGRLPRRRPGLASRGMRAPRGSGWFDLPDRYL